MNLKKDLSAFITCKIKKMNVLFRSHILMRKKIL